MRLTERQVKRVLHDKNYWTYVAGRVIENQQRQAVRRGDVRADGYIVGDTASASVSSLGLREMSPGLVNIREMGTYPRAGNPSGGPTAKGAVHRHLPPEEEDEITISVAPGRTKVDRHLPDEDPDSDSQLDQDGYEEALKREADWLRKQELPSGPMAAAQSLWRREYARIASGSAGRMRG